MATADPVRDKAGPSRPGVRPKNPSRHHLEPNPFEQSFSSKPTNQSSASPDSNQGAGANRSDQQGPRSENSGRDDGEEKGESSHRNEHAKKPSGGGPLTPGSALSNKNNRILPPASSIASPAAAQEAGMHYPWGSSLSGSLRAGPLSPAMLAGPQNFDSFRTGFTPDLSNFKTGLTPLGAAGGSFPPPSPNTAAFLAMMNSTGNNSLSGAAITPGTLSALTGNPIDSHTTNGSNLASQPAEGQHKHNGHGHTESQDYGYFGRQQQHDMPGKTSSSRMTIETQNNADQQDRAGPSGSNAREGAPGGTKQAASGLYLLSQAHRELSKRADGSQNQQGDAHSAQGLGGHPNLKAQSLYSDVAPNNPKNQVKQGSKGPAVNTKRKKSATDSDVSHSAKGGGKKTKAESMDPGSPDYESDELGDEAGHGQYYPGRAGSQAGSDGAGNDEEKRKNFLERNRQAALKCRQRKKAWLASLQAKVEYLQSDNEGLQGTVGALRNEVIFLKSQLLQAQRQLSAHGLGPPPPPGMDAGPPPGGMGSRGVNGPINISGSMGMPNGMPSQHMGPPHGGNMHSGMAGGGSNGGNGGGANGQYAALPRQSSQGNVPAHFGASGQAMHSGKASHGARQSSLQAV